MSEFKIRFPRRLKVIVLALLAAVTTIAFSACGIHCSEQQKALNRIDSIAGNIGRSQITEDDNLIGERHCKDDYTGYYTARCDTESGRDVIFGGASIKERNLRVYGTVYTQSGTAKIRTTTDTYDQYNDGCISYHFYIKPQPYCRRPSTERCCISYHFYIKPQPTMFQSFPISVVYLIISTSNHNH